MAHSTSDVKSSLMTMAIAHKEPLDLGAKYLDLDESFSSRDSVCALFRENTHTCPLTTRLIQLVTFSGLIVFGWNSFRCASVFIFHLSYTV